MVILIHFKKHKMKGKYLSESILMVALILATCAYEIPTNAQNNSESVSRHYVLPEFVNGSVLFKSGKTEEALLNYNTVTEEMIFEKGGKRLAMTNLESIDTVYLGSRKFIPHEKIFYEVLIKDNISLYKKHKCNLLQSGSPSGYGGTSETSATNSISILVGSGSMYKLELPKEYHVKDASQFRISKDNLEFIIANQKQFLKIFPQISNELEQYIKQNKLDIRKQADLVLAITRCNELMR
jgi:hypothetical protein